VPAPESTFAWEKRAANNLSNLAPLPRQAFLLVAVEGFSHEQAAEILDVGLDEFASLLDEASIEISRQVATDILIIEDEPLIAMDIEQLVESLGHRVVGVARTHKEAVAMFGKTQPKMILADIQLADGSSGIDAVNDILHAHSIPVIFITAFPERLLTGERPEPTFLVTKPFNPDMVKALISQALFFDEGSRAAA
jgi:CheY-like chemotaxis protein